MAYFSATQMLTHTGVMAMLTAAVARAEAIEQPQCVVIVDNRCTVLGELHMTGSKVLSRETATAKAVTSASHNLPSASIPEAARQAVAAATGGQITGLPGGLPIRHNGHLLGGIGVGSGAPSQDLDVAAAALEAIGADPIE